MARLLCAVPSWSGRRRLSCLFLAALSVLACNFPPGLPTVSPALPPSPVSGPTPTPVETTIPPTPVLSATLPFPDASSVLSGVCFSFLQTLDGKTVVLDSPHDLAAFYDQVDKSKRCRDTVERKDFDFSNYQIVGTVVTGEGCSIGLAYEGATLDDQAHQRVITFRAAVGGDCGYQLAHPLWLAVDRPAPGYTTQLRISTSP